MLDVIVDPDGRWRYKDEDELEAFVSNGLFDEALNRRIRDEAERVIAKVQRNEAPFSEPWPEWQPDPSWDIPALPEGWDQV